MSVFDYPCAEAGPHQFPLHATEPHGEDESRVAAGCERLSGVEH